MKLGKKLIQFLSLIFLRIYLFLGIFLFSFCLGIADVKNCASLTYSSGKFFDDDSELVPHQTVLDICKAEADKGMAYAQFYFGRIYYDKGNYLESNKWYLLSALGGDFRAQINLGNAYYNGEGVTQDHKEAVKWYRLSAEQNFSYAQYNLGRAYYEGRGVTQDYEEAVRWFRLSAEQNFSYAQFNLGIAYYHGLGVTKNYVEAVRWFRLSAEQNNPSAQLELGLAYYDGRGVTQNYVEAVRWFRLSAKQNDPVAQSNLGSAYYQGKGVTQDYEEGLRWFRLSAKQNDPVAQYNLGIAYYNGDGITQDYEEAVRWLRLSAEQNNPSAQSVLGILYYHGDGITQDYEEAVRWFRLSAEQNHPEAQYNLGFAYYHGNGVNHRDYEEAVQWFRLSAEQNNPSAQLELGIAYYEGRGVTKNYVEAVRWFRLSAKQNYPKAQYNLGIAYYYGKGVTQDYEKAVSWFRLSAEQNNPSAQYNLGIAYYNGKGVTQDYKEAVSWFRLSAEQNHSRAQLELGRAYYHGNGVTQDYKEAVSWFRLSAEQNNPEAQYNLGSAYYQGKGVTQDYEEAVRWLRLSAEQNHPVAQNSLGNAYYYGNGVTQDYEEAARWYRISAKQSNPFAQYNLGLMYQDTVWVDYKEAEKWLKLSAEQNHTNAQHSLGWLYFTIPEYKDINQAIYYTELASDSDDPLIKVYALNNLGVFYDRLDQTDKSLQYYEMSSDLAFEENIEFPLPAANVVRNFFHRSNSIGEEGQLLENLIDKVYRYAKIAKNSSDKSEAFLSKLLVKYNPSEIPKKELLKKWITLEIMLGKTEGLLELGWLYDNLEANPKEAVKWFMLCEYLCPEEDNYRLANVELSLLKSKLSSADYKDGKNRARSWIKDIWEKRSEQKIVNNLEKEKNDFSKIIGKNFALLIGVKNYENFSTLNTPLNDVRKLKEILSDKYDFTVAILEDAGREKILKSLNAYKKILKENDNLIIYFAGHGKLEAEEGHWLPQDAYPDEDYTWISNSYIKRKVGSFAANNILVIADSCFSGTITRGVKFDNASKLGQETIDAFITVKTFLETKTRVAITSGGNEPVYDGGGGKYSVFAKTFFETLEVLDEPFTSLDLFQKIRNQVISKSQTMGDTQTPMYKELVTSGHQGPDFVFIPN